MYSEIFVKESKQSSIYNDLKEKILKLEVEPGTKISGIRQLMKHYDASYNTVYKSIKQLEKEKLLTCLQGKGIFVRSLTKQTKKVGFIVTNMDIPFFSKMIRFLEKELSSYKVDIIIKNSGFDSSVELKIIQQMVQNGVDGLLIVPTFDSAANNYAQFVENCGIPIIYLLREKIEMPCHSFVMDDYQCARNIAKFLSESGHKRAAIISSQLLDERYDQKARGFISGAKKYGIQIAKDHFFRGSDFETNSGYYCMKKLLSLDIVRPSVVFCYTDNIAAGAIKACKEAMIEVPKDISIVGWNNDEVSTLIEPSITTVDVPLEMLVKLSVKTLIDMINDDVDLPKPRKVNAIIKTELIKRDSVQIFFD